MYSKPLTYDSLKTVLYHLDPNIRFLISIRIPSLRVAERSVPLKIEYLQFNSTQFEVNETRYSLNVCLEGRDDPLSLFIRDVNEYGEAVGMHDTVVMPGDVVLRPLNGGLIPPMTEQRMTEQIEHYEREIEINRLRLALLDSVAQEHFVEMPTNYNQDLRNTFLHGDEAQMRALGNSPEVEEARRYAATYFGWRIKTTEHSLQPLLNRRDNVRPNFEFQLKITSPGGVRTERVKYTAKLHSAEKSLLKMMFGNRKHVVQVKKLEISDHMPIRFPLGLKMKIRELESIDNVRRIHSALSGVVVSSSYPLEELGVEYEDGQDMEHEIVNSAKALIIFSGPLVTPTLPVFLNLQNKKVHARDYTTMTTEEHVQLIKKWLEVGKPNGTCYTFSMRNEQKSKEILEMVEQQCNGAVAEEQCVVIPMNVNLVLKLSNEIVLEEGHESWMFKMEVLPPGSPLI